MRVLIAPDSFKGSLSAEQVAKSIKRGIEQACQATSQKNEEWLIDICPMADGGEGTVDALVYNTGGQKIKSVVNDPLGRSIVAEYGILGDKTTAIIEMAAASGLPLLTAEERNPLQTSSYGTGQLIADALSRGCRSLLIGIGGSATNDGGMGMLAALGYRFLDADGRVLTSCGRHLQEIKTIDERGALPVLKAARFRVACDVDNPLLGEKGATAVYGPQKGADSAMVKQLEQGMNNYATVIEEYLGRVVRQVPGAGAAGGLGAGLLAFLGAELVSGFSLVSQTVDLPGQVRRGNYQLLITGEGQMNHQTLHGKLPYGISQLGVENRIPVIAFVGGLGEGYEAMYDAGLTSVFSLVSSPMSLKTAMHHSDQLLTSVVERVFRMYLG